MAESPGMALGRAIRTRAAGPTEPWANRVYRGQAPAKAERPYCVYLLTSGTKAQFRRARDARMIVTIKCVADDAMQSEMGAGRIVELFDDLGQSRAVTLNCAPNWTLVHSQLQRYISLVENLDGAATQIFHDGAMFVFHLEAI